MFFKKYHFWVLHIRNSLWDIFSPKYKSIYKAFWSQFGFIFVVKLSSIMPEMSIKIFFSKDGLDFWILHLRKSLQAKNSYIFLEGGKTGSKDLPTHTHTHTHTKFGPYQTMPTLRKKVSLPKTFCLTSVSDIKSKTLHCWKWLGV